MQLIRGRQLKGKGTVVLQGVKKRGRPKGSKNRLKNKPPADAARTPIASAAQQHRAAPKRQAAVANMAVLLCMLFSIPDRCMPSDWAFAQSSAAGPCGITLDVGTMSQMPYGIFIVRCGLVGRYAVVWYGSDIKCAIRLCKMPVKPE